MVIRWTPLARKSLQDIYQFYYPKTGRIKALQIVSEIEKETEYLLIFPELGACEEIGNKKTFYRYIIKNNCKLYYTIHPEYIRINFIWDTRRNPEYLRQYLK